MNCSPKGLAIWARSASNRWRLYPFCVGIAAKRTPRCNRRLMHVFSFASSVPGQQDPRIEAEFKDSAEVQTLAFPLHKQDLLVFNVSLDPHWQNLECGSLTVSVKLDAWSRCGALLQSMKQAEKQCCCHMCRKGRQGGKAMLQPRPAEMSLCALRTEFLKAWWATFLIIARRPDFVIIALERLLYNW